MTYRLSLIAVAAVVPPGSVTMRSSALAGTVTVAVPSAPTVAVVAGPGFQSSVRIVPGGTPSQVNLTFWPWVGGDGEIVIEALPIGGIVAPQRSSSADASSVFAMRPVSARPRGVHELPSLETPA